MKEEMKDATGVDETIIDCAMEYMAVADKLIEAGKPVGQVITALHSAAFMLVEERSPDAKAARLMKKALIESDVSVYEHDFANAEAFEQRCAKRLFEKLDTLDMAYGDA